MSLTGTALLVLATLVTAGAFAAVVVLWPRLAGPQWRVVAGRAGLLLTVNALVLVTAALQLNAQFLFYANWADLTGSLGSQPAASALHRGGDAAAASRAALGGDAAAAPATLPSLAPGHGGTGGTGGILRYMVHGSLSGLTGVIEAQLPPGYASATQAQVKYPVLETFSGYPGAPGQWLRTMGLGSVLARAVAGHQMRPAVIVSPQVEFPPGADTESVNGVPGRPQVETWLTRDVPNWVTHTFRVSTQRGSWATIGFSAGGWAAAMATMLHPSQYSAAIVLGGYFRPEFGPLYEPYPPASPLAARYDLVKLAARHPPPVALWLETSHSDATSYSSSAALLHAVHAPMAVSATVLRHAGHRISIWQGLLPQAVRWLGATVPGFGPRP